MSDIFSINPMDLFKKQRASEAARDRSFEEWFEHFSATIDPLVPKDKARAIFNDAYLIGAVSEQGRVAADIIELMKEAGKESK